MLSACAILQEIRNDPEAFRLFLSVAARGEEQGGWENESLAALTPNTELAEKIKRHRTDEHKHSRYFSMLLKKREVSGLPVSPELDYIMQLTNAGVGVSHERLRNTQKATDQEIIQYLAHGRVPEQRGREEIDLLDKIFKDDPELAPGLVMVAEDEINPLSRFHEKLLRFTRKGHGEIIRQTLKHYAMIKIGIFQEVSLAFTDQLARILQWAEWKRKLIRLGHPDNLLDRTRLDLAAACVTSPARTS